MVIRYAMLGLALFITGMVGWQTYGWLYPVKPNLKLVFHARVGEDTCEVTGAHGLVKHAQSGEALGVGPALLA